MASTQTDDLAAIARNLHSWLANDKTKFSRLPKKKFAKCVASNEDQRNKLDALFQGLEVSSEIDNKTIAFGVYRLPSGPLPVSPGDGGWAILVPLRFIDSSPTAFGRNLEIGEVIRMTETIDVTGAVDILLITPTSALASSKSSKSGSKKPPRTGDSTSKSSGS